MNDIYLRIAMFFLNRMSFRCASNQQRLIDRRQAVAKLHQCR